MKKTIKIICWVFILCTIIENINFMFAQFEDTEENPVNEIEYLNNEHKSDSNPWEEIPEQVTNPDNNQTSSEDNKEEASSSEEITNQIEEDLNITPSPKLRWTPMMTVSQSTQQIKTANYGIIRIKDPEHPWRWITIHDRNLWATATWYWATNDINTYWYYFQWWNNYGFPSDPSETILTDTTPVDSSEYWPHTNNWYYSSDTFIKWNSDWSSVRNDNLRWWEWDNENNEWWLTSSNPISWRHWPCPDWRHVPSIWERNKLINLWTNEYYSSSYNDDYNTSFIKRFYVPFAWRRIPDMQLDGFWILLRSSSPYWSSAKRLYYSSDGLTTASYNDRNYAFPIRCFYDSYRLPVKILYKINWWYWTDDESIKDKIITYTKDNDNSEFSWNIALWTVKRDNNCWENGDKKCMFGWRYTLTGDELWTWNITEDITLYAKWLEFDDLDIPYSGVNFSIMDRNLWAINSWIDENAYGYYLTWWEDDIMCPEWYHIPSTWEWLWIKKLLDSDFNWNLVKILFNLPFAGKLINDEVVENEENGYYLAKDWDDIKYAKISDSDIEIKNLEDWERITARCFKNYNTWTIKFHTNWWKSIADIITANRREDGQYLNDAVRDNSIFSWWYMTPDFKEWSKLERNINYKNEEEINLYAKWECEEWYTKSDNQCNAIYFNIKWIDGDGNTLKIDSVKWWEIPVYDWAIPTKSSTNDYKYTFNNNWLPTVTSAFEDTGYAAQFDAEYIKKSGWSSGWGGRRNRQDSIISNVDSASGDSDKSTRYQTWISPDDLNLSVTTWQLPLKEELNKIEQGVPPFQMGMSKVRSASWGQGDYPQEFIDAYNFAYKNWITTKSSIQDAKMYSPLTRIQMAKMLSNYAISVLWKTPDVTKWVIKFSDVSNKLNKEYDNAPTIAYQLWIMWQNMKNNKFRPHDEVTRAEFVTALSRLSYWIEDWRWNNKYYEPHITKLYNKWIINKADSAMKEKRWYVMIIIIRNFNKIYF